MAAGVAALQYHNDFGHLEIFADYARVLRAGLDPAAARHGVWTCPMWGYGFIVACTRSKAVMLLLQNTLALLATRAFLRSLATHAVLTPRGLRLLKAGLLFSLPWFAFHSAIGERGIGASLFLLALNRLFHRARRPGEGWLALALSGVCFGAMLNFRSDYFLLPLLLSPLIPAFHPIAWRTLGRWLAWLACLYGMLIPWAVYTHRATGHALLTSTNAGHVLFCGLGGRPGNQWGLTQHDLDPTLLRIVAREAGPGAPTCGYAGNAVLRRHWRARVLASPLEYLRGCAYAGAHLAIGGVYSGAFDPRFTSQIKARLQHTSLRQLADRELFARDTGINGRILLNGISEATGRLVLLTACLCWPLALVTAWRRRDKLALTICVSVGYQWAINIFVSNIRGYTTTLYPFYLLLPLYLLCAPRPAPPHWDTPAPA